MTNILDRFRFEPRAHYFNGSRNWLVVFDRQRGDFIRDPENPKKYMTFRNSDDAQAYIKANIPHLETPEITLPTPMGDLVLSTEPDANIYGKVGAFISLKASEDPYAFADVAAVRVDEEGMEIYVWGDLNDEDPTHHFRLTKDNIAGFIEFCKD